MVPMAKWASVAGWPVWRYFSIARWNVACEASSFPIRLSAAPIQSVAIGAIHDRPSEIGWRRRIASVSRPASMSFCAKASSFSSVEPLPDRLSIAEMRPASASLPSAS